MIRFDLFAKLIAGITVCGTGYALLATSPVQAECSQWNMSGHWEFQLSNGDWDTFDLGQTPCGDRGFGLSGRFNRYSAKTGRSYAGGPIHGTLRGSKFNLEDRDEAGDNLWIRNFQGVIDPNGRPSGAVPEKYVLVKGQWDKYQPPATLTFWEKTGRQAECREGTEVTDKPLGGVGAIIQETQPPTSDPKPKGMDTGDFLKKTK